MVTTTISRPRAVEDPPKPVQPVMMSGGIGAVLLGFISDCPPRMPHVDYEGRLVNPQATP